MTTGTIGSLLVLWLSVGPPSHSSNPAPSATATRIAGAWSAPATPSLGVIDHMINTCGHPRVIIVPPRPGDPLQEPLVARLAADLEPYGIDVLNGERLQSDQERKADMVYAETSDAAAATRILLGRRGDYEVAWRLEVAIEGPKTIYGVETWEASGGGQATIIDLLTGDELEGVDVTAAARKQTREHAVDRAIEAITDSLANRISGPILRDWYGFATGEGVVRVDVSGQIDHLEDLRVKLKGLQGVETVTRASPAEPPRLLVRGWRTAPDIVHQLDQGTAVSCRNLEVFIGTGLWWALWVVGGVGGLVAIIVIVMLLTGRQPDPEIEA